MFFHNCWYMAGWSHELDDGRLLPRTLLEQPVLLFRGESGAAIALDNRCAHRGALLSNGRREGDCVRCMYHGLKFDATGRCVQIPGQDMVPAKLAVRRYPLVERQGVPFDINQLKPENIDALIEQFNDLKAGDMIEVFAMERVLTPA